METRISVTRKIGSLSGTTWVGPACHRIYSYYGNSYLSNTKTGSRPGTTWAGPACHRVYSYYGNSYLCNTKTRIIFMTTWVGPACHRIYSYYGNSYLSNTKNRITVRNHMGRASLSQNIQLLWKLVSQQHEKHDHCQEPHG